MEWKVYFLKKLLMIGLPGISRDLWNEFAFNREDQALPKHLLGQQTYRLKNLMKDRKVVSLYNQHYGR